MDEINIKITRGKDARQKKHMFTPAEVSLACDALNPTDALQSLSGGGGCAVAFAIPAPPVVAPVVVPAVAFVHPAPTFAHPLVEYVVPTAPDAAAPAGTFSGMRYALTDGSMNFTV